MNLAEIKDRNIDFIGTKIALINENKILSILRDDKDTIPFSNMWDLPGGGRENHESAFECAKREVFEELSIEIKIEDAIYYKIYNGIVDYNKKSFFIVSKISQAEIDNIKFGDEGQAYKMIEIDKFLKDENVIHSLKERLKEYLKVGN